MKIIFTYIGLIMIGLGATTQSHAAMCDMHICNEYEGYTATEPQHCARTMNSAYCYWHPGVNKYFIQRECASCPSGYKLVTKTNTDLGCTVEYTTCESIPYDNCSEWQHDTIDPEYDYQECNGGTEYNLRCHIGYYGVPTVDSDYNFHGCTKCPENASCPGATATFQCLEEFYQNGDTCALCPRGPSGVEWIYSQMGSTDITDCYILSGSPFNDDTGSGTYTADCHYTK